MMNWVSFVCTRETLNIMEQRYDTIKSVFKEYLSLVVGEKHLEGKVARSFSINEKGPVPEKFGWKRSIKGRSISEEFILDTWLDVVANSKFICLFNWQDRDAMNQDKEWK